MADDTSIATAYLDESFRTFRGYKRMADAALAQLSDQQFFHVPDVESNSVALVVKHMAGNLRSRWTDFLTTDGEKPDRDRDQEFVLTEADTRAELMHRWEQAWETTFASIKNLKPEDLGRTVYIRREPHTVVQAMSRSTAHMAYHVGQIVYQGKHLRGAEWKTLSIPRGKSAEVNAKKLEERTIKSPART